MKTKNLTNVGIVAMALGLLIAIVLFETSQQLYYLIRFDLNLKATFSDLFFGQLRKWGIWLLCCIPLWFYIKKYAFNKEFSAQTVSFSLLFILALLLLATLTISALEVWIAGQPLVEEGMWKSYFVFYLFQKAPIFLFGFTFIAFIFLLFLKNNLLEFEILKIKELNRKDKKLLSESRINQEEPVLRVKVGHSYKIVPIETIDWIEADDYCVNIYCKQHDTAYSMRASLKSLEKILPANFLRVHRSAIVNMDNVVEYKTTGGSSVKLDTGAVVSVAHNKAALINDFFKNTEITEQSVYIPENTREH